MKREKSSWLSTLLIGLALLYPLTRSLWDIITGIIPFWVDPALDFLLADENLSKPRLIGQPSGVEGIFYGPYTIWLTSLGLLISPDPRAIVFLLHVLPYFIIFPYLLYRLFRPYSIGRFLSLWMLFILSYRNFTTYLWSPHHAPLLVLWLLYLIVGLSRQSRLQYVAVGFLAGLVANFHLSFGIAVVLATLVNFLIPVVVTFTNSTRRRRGDRNRLIKSWLFVLAGVLLSFLPAILFELRHDFLQTRALLTLISHIGQGGERFELASLGKREILTSFISPLAKLMSLPPQFAPVLMGLIVLTSGLQLLAKPARWTQAEKRLGGCIMLFSLVTLGIYLGLDKNIWHYHFIGVETIMLVTLGLLSAKSRLWHRLIIVVAAIVVANSFGEFTASLRYDPLAVPSLAAKRRVVETILSDAPQEGYAVSVYSPSLLTYDYDYLFSWLAAERGLPRPSPVVSGSRLVYLVISEASPTTEATYMQTITPESQFQTTSLWRNPDRSLIIKRELL